MRLLQTREGKPNQPVALANDPVNSEFFAGRESAGDNQNLAGKESWCYTTRYIIPYNYKNIVNPPVWQFLALKLLVLAVKKAQNGGKGGEQ